ncbi:MAG TPA: hypothetical protein VLT88_05570, partial [Desulfosarcina sp.]|nr:hypothetical protein [Desulfosarcina sp.]
MPIHRRLAAWFAGMLLLLPGTACCGGLDGTVPIFGTGDQLVEVNRQRIVGEVDPGTVGLPTSFIIDFDANTMRGTADSLVRRLV